MSDTGDGGTTNAGAIRVDCYNRDHGLLEAAIGTRATDIVALFDGTNSSVCHVLATFSCTQQMVTLELASAYV